MKQTWTKKVRELVEKKSYFLVPLSDGSFAKIDKDDKHIADRWNWSINDKGYAYRGKSKGDGKAKNISLHREILGAKESETVDHINGDRRDNRKKNLRLVSMDQNAINRKLSSRNKSGFKGVSFRKDTGKWRACISKNGVLIRIGNYETKEQAARAYDKKAIKLHGEYAVLNFPLDNCGKESGQG